MMGYLGEEDRTMEVFNENGWLKSGKHRLFLLLQ